MVSVQLLEHLGKYEPLLAVRKIKISFSSIYNIFLAKNVISLSVDNTIKNHWKCAFQSLLSSIVNIEIFYAIVAIHNAYQI